VCITRRELKTMILVRSRRQPVWTFIFIAVSILLFVFQQITSWWIYLAFFPAYALRFPWMFITSVFLHADLSHLLFNLFALYFFGSSLERRIGGKLFAVLFLLSGIFGNLGYMITASNPYVPGLGASGAIYGAIGALAILVPFMVVLVYGMMPLPMVVAALLWALMDFMGLFAPSGIAHGAHLGGMIVGAIFGLYLRQQMRRLESAR